MERVRTGVAVVDKLSGGGLPRGSMILLIGSPGSGKSVLARHFLYNGIVENESSMLIETKESKGRIREEFESLGLDSEILDKLIYLDCTGSGSSIENVTDLSLAINFLTKTVEIAERVRLVFDTFSDIISMHSPDVCYKFLRNLKDVFQRKGVTALIIIGEGLHGSQVELGIENICDGTIRMRVDENGRSLCVPRMLATPTEIKWTGFRIEKGEITT